MSVSFWIDQEPPPPPIWQTFNLSNFLRQGVRPIQTVSNTVCPSRTAGSCVHHTHCLDRTHRGGGSVQRTPLWSLELHQEHSFVFLLLHILIQLSLQNHPHSPRGERTRVGRSTQPQTVPSDILDCLGNLHPLSTRSVPLLLDNQRNSS